MQLAVCNGGAPDCADGSDEVNCQLPHFIPTSGPSTTFSPHPESQQQQQHQQQKGGGLVGAVVTVGVVAVLAICAALYFRRTANTNRYTRADLSISADGSGDDDDGDDMELASHPAAAAAARTTPHHSSSYEA
jgi:hypothetical protein